MRKFFAILCSIITLAAFKETLKIFISDDPDIAGQRPILIVIALSLSIPLVILTLWLWISSRKIKQL